MSRNRDRSHDASRTHLRIVHDSWRKLDNFGGFSTRVALCLTLPPPLLVLVLLPLCPSHPPHDPDDAIPVTFVPELLDPGASCSWGSLEYQHAERHDRAVHRAKHPRRGQLHEQRLHRAAGGPPAAGGRHGVILFVCRGLPPCRTRTWWCRLILAPRPAPPHRTTVGSSRLRWDGTGRACLWRFGTRVWGLDPRRKIPPLPLSVMVFEHQGAGGDAR